jgi:hypothetical protein
MLAAFLIERVGRHNTLSAGMLLAGVGSLLCALVPAGSAQAVMAAVSKFGCAGAFSVASIFTSELFPTLVRSAVLGLENEAARVGGIAAPFIVLAGSQMHNAALPFLLFGCTSLLASLLIITLPETLGAPMPDSMQDMTAIQSVFTTSEHCCDARAPSENDGTHDWRWIWTGHPRTYTACMPSCGELCLTRATPTRYHHARAQRHGVVAGAPPARSFSPRGQHTHPSCQPLSGSPPSMRWTPQQRVGHQSWRVHHLRQSKHQTLGCPRTRRWQD